MCGIVGYVGPQDATPIILSGLKRLEYRGYDSAGLAVLENGSIQVRRDAGKLSRLAALVEESPVHGHIGIGHTRWATHGEPSSPQRPPPPRQHRRGRGGAQRHRRELPRAARGADRRGRGLQLGHRHRGHRPPGRALPVARGFGLVEAVREALTLLKGAHGIVVLSALEPDKIVAARIGNAGGVVIGLGEGEMFVASDMPAILEHTRQVVFLESGQMAVVTRDGLDRSDPGRQAARSTRCTPSPGTRSPRRRASTGTSCRRRSTSRCAR